jgi:hypothetical protein
MLRSCVNNIHVSIVHTTHSITSFKIIVNTYGDVETVPERLLLNMRENTRQEMKYVYIFSTVNINKQTKSQRK